MIQTSFLAGLHQITWKQTLTCSFPRWPISNVHLSYVNIFGHKHFILLLLYVELSSVSFKNKLFDIEFFKKSKSTDPTISSCAPLILVYFNRFSCLQNKYLSNSHTYIIQKVTSWIFKWAIVRPCRWSVLVAMVTERKIAWFKKQQF